LDKDVRFAGKQLGYRLECPPYWAHFSSSHHELPLPRPDPYSRKWSNSHMSSGTSNGVWNADRCGSTVELAFTCIGTRASTACYSALCSYLSPLASRQIPTGSVPRIFNKSALRESGLFFFVKSAEQRPPWQDGRVQKRYRCRAIRPPDGLFLSAVTASGSASC